VKGNVQSNHHTLTNTRHTARQTQPNSHRCYQNLTPIHTQSETFRAGANALLHAILAVGALAGNSVEQPTPARVSHKWTIVHIGFGAHWPFLTQMVTFRPQMVKGDTRQSWPSVHLGMRNDSQNISRRTALRCDASSAAPQRNAPLESKLIETRRWTPRSAGKTAEQTQHTQRKLRHTAEQCDEEEKCGAMRRGECRGSQTTSEPRICFTRRQRLRHPCSPGDGHRRCRVWIRE
jgi:hypothetical protein